VREKSKHLVKDVPFVSCPYCKGENNKFKLLHWKHLKGHNKTIEDVRIEFPDLPTMTKEENEIRKNISKMGGDKFKENLKDGKTKIVKCYYYMDDDCPGNDFEVPLTSPSYVLCDTCKSNEKENPDGRTKDEAKLKREMHFESTYGKGIKNPQQIKEVKQRTISTNKKEYGGVGFSSKELSKKSEDTIEKVYGERNIMKTKEGLNRYVNGVMKNLNIDNPMKDPEIAKKSGDSNKGKPSKLKGKDYIEIHGEEKAKELIEEKRFSGAEACSKMGPEYISIPQKELYYMVKEIFPEAILQYPIFGYCLDIAITDLKIYLEYDGSYWHNEEKDKIRDGIMEKLGWKKLRFKDRIPSKEELFFELNNLI
jgi:hypothetical protein